MVDQNPLERPRDGTVKSACHKTISTRNGATLLQMDTTCVPLASRARQEGPE